jgi:hypothetical protein
MVFLIAWRGGPVIHSTRSTRRSSGCKLNGGQRLNAASALKRQLRG